MLRNIPAKRSRTRDGLAHVKEEQKDKQDPKLNSLAQGDGNQLPSEKQKIPTRRHQERGRRAVDASYIEMLIFFPQFPKFFYKQGLGGYQQCGSMARKFPAERGLCFLVPQLFNSLQRKCVGTRVSICDLTFPPTNTSPLCFRQVSQINWFQLFLRRSSLKF